MNRQEKGDCRSDLMTEILLKSSFHYNQGVTPRKPSFETYSIQEV